MKIKSLAAACAAVLVRPLLLALLPGASGAAPAATDAQRIAQTMNARFASVVKVADATTVSVSNAWARATPFGVPVGAAYFTITNHGTQPDTLVAVASPAAATIEVHRTAVENGMARMRPAGPIVIAPGQSVRVETGGLHVMLMDLKAPLVAGTRVPLVLTFRMAGTITVQMNVQPATFVSHAAKS